jgi:DNA mismatch repair protein MutS
MRYLDETQKNALSNQRHAPTNRSSYMVLDATRAETSSSPSRCVLAATRKTRVIHLIDTAKTGMGGRCCGTGSTGRCSPSRDRTPPGCGRRAERQSCAAQKLQELLHGIYDIERLCSKIVYGSVNARTVWR